MVRALRRDAHILQRQTDFAPDFLALVLGRGVHKAGVVERHIRRIAFAVIFKEVELASCPKIKYYTMELGNVNCFFQNSAAVDVEAAAVRAADVAVKAHDAPVHGAPRQQRHRGGIGHEKQLAVVLALEARDARGVDRDARFQRLRHQGGLDGDDLLAPENVAERQLDELDVVFLNEIQNL